MNKPFTVGITGGSGSGKTLFLEKLIHSFKPDEVCLISQDNYYKSIDLQQKDENGIENFDIPESFDFEAYESDLKKLQSGKEVSRPEYTFNNTSQEPKMMTFKPAPVLVVEGIFVFYHPSFANLLDLKIFIDAKEHLMLKRRILRDKVERGYDLDDVLYRYENHVMPAYDKYIGPYKNEADLVIPNNKNFDRALDVIHSYLSIKSGASSKF